MSIGKSSIARAVNATAAKTQNTTTDNVITKLNIQDIGLLSIAKTPDDIHTLKTSIAKRGLLCPVLVAATSKGDLWLIDGYARLFAAKELGMTHINSAVIKIENKTEANKIYTELSKLKTEPQKDSIREEKFRVLAVKDHDLPTYLL